MFNDEFKSIVTEYEKLVLTICYQFTRDYHKAEDLAQETFISAYLHIDSCRREDIRPWLARIATNKAKDYLKSSYHKTTLLSEDLEKDNVIRLEPSAADLYLEKEKVNQIRDVIYSLKEPYLKVSELFFIKEKSVGEIAEILGRPKKTVETQIYRAKTMLQAKLREEL